MHHTGVCANTFLKAEPGEFLTSLESDTEVGACRSREKKYGVLEAQPGPPPGPLRPPPAGLRADPEQAHDIWKRVDI